jgi:ribonuclease-3
LAGRSEKSRQLLSERLGYIFSDPAILRRALTHASARAAKKIKRDNERLEFLGDRVLGLCIAELLMKAFPDEEEGDLARRFNRLVRKETCAEIADLDWDLGSAMIMSGGEVISGGRRKITILGNACEAVLGAIYLDGGFDSAREVIARFWGPRLRGAEEAPMDAKTALQEWAQARGLPLPAYVEVKRTGPDHAPHFVIRAEVEGYQPASGEGANKRLAEQAAARAWLTREGVWRESGDEG